MSGGLDEDEVVEEIAQGIVFCHFICGFPISLLFPFWFWHEGFVGYSPLQELKRDKKNERLFGVFLHTHLILRFQQLLDELWFEMEHDVPVFYFFVLLDRNEHNLSLPRQGGF